MHLASIEKSCCGNCRKGKPCDSRAERKPPAFSKRRGLWLPRRTLDVPKSLLHNPTGEQWGGFWRPWLPAKRLSLYREFDLSCLPCCNPGTDCNACDPGTATLTGTISGAITGAAQSLTANACSGIDRGWNYGLSVFVVTNGCDPGWVSVDVCVFCKVSTGGIWASAGGGGGQCSLPGTEIEADSWTCSPFSATFSMHLAELFPGGCAGCGAGDGDLVTLTITL